MAEYIDKEFVIETIEELKSKALPKALLFDHLKKVIEIFPTEDFAPVKHGHIVWKEYHKGGIRRRKCLQEIKSVYIEQQMPCKHIAIVDERYLSKDPYCSECGMLLGEFLSYCGNCGAKMDGGDNNA